MSKLEMLRSFVNQRLTAAYEEIFGLLERTIAEYEEELYRSKEENKRQRKLLDAVFNPEVRIRRADVQQLLLVKEEVPSEQQEWSSSLDQEDPEPPHIKAEQEDPEPPHIKEEQEDPEPPHIKEEQEDPKPPHIKEEQEDPEPPHIKEEQEDPEPPHIKEEQEELCTSQEGEQLQGLEEADVKFSFTPVKSEEEEAQSSQLHQRQTEQMKTDADGEDCGGPEPDRNLDPDRHPEPDTDEKTGDSSDTDGSGDWKKTREPQSGLNYVKPDEVSDSRCSAGEKLFSCSECEKTFGKRGTLNRHMRIHTGEKPFSCSVCKKSFNWGSTLQTHMRTHTGEKPFSCSVCKKSFKQGSHLQIHMKTHTGEKPFSCSVCKKSFNRGSNLQTHMGTHTGEKPFSCSIAGGFS
ncbi:uncharacterized protein PEZ65_016474 [Lycodopsis pacificus]